LGRGSYNSTSCLITLGPPLFQKGDEAYLFLGAGHMGWHFPALSYPWVVAKGYLRIPTEFSDQSGQSLVIRVTPEGVQRRWTYKSSDISLLTPFEDGFYARCPGTVLCKWTGKGFDPVNAEEEKRIGIDNPYVGSFDNTVINGWTAHVLKYVPGDHFKVQIGQDVVIDVRNDAGSEPAYSNTSVDLLRPGKAPENLLRANAKPRRVSWSEYEQLFGKK
jgi:hypothetical protein